MAKYNFRALHELQGASASRCSADRAVYRSSGVKISISLHRDIHEKLGLLKGDYGIVVVDTESNAFGIRRKRADEAGGYSIRSAGARIMVRFRASGVFPCVAKPVLLDELELTDSMVIFKMPGGIIK